MYMSSCIRPSNVYRLNPTVCRLPNHIASPIIDLNVLSIPLQVASPTLRHTEKPSLIAPTILLPCTPSFLHVSLFITIQRNQCSLILGLKVRVWVGARYIAWRVVWWHWGLSSYGWQWEVCPPISSLLQIGSHGDVAMVGFREEEGDTQA
jgi:hypothetical protein